MYCVDSIRVLHDLLEALKAILITLFSRSHFDLCRDHDEEDDLRLSQFLSFFSSIQMSKS